MIPADQTVVKHLKIIYAITPELRKTLKTPFGILLCGTFPESMKKFATIVEERKPPKIVTVGDTVTRNLHRHGISPQLSITDNRSMRKPIRQIIYPVDKIVKVKNPQGTITEEAAKAVHEAILKSEKVQIRVDGEEDLLTIIAVLNSPEKTLVVYGQPYEGMVVVEVTAEKKAEASRILEAMKVRKPK